MGLKSKGNDTKPFQLEQTGTGNWWYLKTLQLSLGGVLWRRIAETGAVYLIGRKDI